MPALSILSSSTPPRRLMFWLIAGTAAAFLPTLGGGFIADDFAYIARFREFPWAEWSGLFTHDWSGGLWGEQLRELRPFVALSFMGDARWFGGGALGYRLTNLALHLIATFLVMRLAWFYATELTRGRPDSRAPQWAMAVSGLIFGLHPAHAEAVGWITGRVDLQATVGALLFWAGAESYVHGGRRLRVVVALLAFFVGIFSKELCLFAPLLLLLRWVILDPRAGATAWRRRLIVIGGVAVLLTVYGLCRHAAFGPHTIGYSLWRDEPAWQRQAHYAGWLLPILPFFAKGEWQAFPALTTLHGLWFVIAGTTVVGLAIALARRRPVAAAALFFGGLWYLLTVSPLTGVVYFSPRHLYFPSVGLALAAGLMVAFVRGRRFLVMALGVWFVAGHVAAILPWRASASVSQRALAAVQTELNAVGPGALLITSVPETYGPTLLWAWSSPQCVNPPFVTNPPARTIERPANYTRSATWMEDHKPYETIAAATKVIVLGVDSRGRVACRRFTAADWAPHAAAFAALAARGLSPEAWVGWVEAIAFPLNQT
jgi:hypothetical protein